MESICHKGVQFPFDLTASTPFTWVHTPVAERENYNNKKKSLAYLRVVNVVMQLVGGITKIISTGRSSLLPHSGPDWALFLAAPCMPNSKSCLSWVKAKNYQHGSQSCRADEPPQHPKQLLPPRKQICDLHNWKCFDWLLRPNIGRSGDTISASNNNDNNSSSTDCGGTPGNLT